MNCGNAPSIQYCNAEEPILVPLNKSFCHLNLGCPLSSLPKTVNILELMSKQNGGNKNGGNISWKWSNLNEKLLCIVDKKERIAWMVVVEGATQENMFDSLFSIEYFGLTKRF